MRYLVIVTIIAAVIVALTFVSIGPVPAQNLSFTGELEKGDLTFDETGEYYDTYEIELEAGQFVDVYLSSESFDTYLLLVTPDGTDINIDDYFTDDSNAALYFVARQTGVYTFYVSSSKPGETGSYELTCETRDTTLEQTHEGALSADDDVSWKGGEYYDRYELELGPYEKRVLTLDSDDFEVYLAIHQPDDFVDYVFGYPAAEIVEADETGGTYTLVVTSINNKEVGGYRLEIREVGELPEPDDTGDEAESAEQAEPADEAEAPDGSESRTPVPG